MNDLDDRITRVLAAHARHTEIDDRLDDITYGGRIISWTETSDDERGTTRSRLVAVAAACLLIVAGGFALMQIDRDVEPAPPATQPDDTNPARPLDPTGRVFPLMRSLPEGISHLYATSVTFVKPATTSLTLGRVEGDHMVDVSTVSAARITPSDSEPVLVPPDALTSIATIGDREVTVYDNAGGRWYRWSNDDVVVLVQASQDSDAIVRRLSTTIDTSGFVAIELGELPPGLEVAAAPDPLVGNHPGLSTDAGPDEPTFDLFPTDMPLMVNTDVVDDYRIVDINGTRGFSASTDGGAIVTWPIADGVWLRLGASDTDARQLADVARDVQLVDEDSWRNEYGTGFTQSVAPAPSTEP